jgi:hypothetical protein
MTDTPAPPGASALLPDTPLPDKPLPLGGPDWSPESRARSDAHAEIARLKGDSDFQQLLLKGDPSALAKVQQLQRTINTGSKTVVGGEPNPAEIQQRLDSWATFADLSPEVITQLKNGQPVTKQEYDMAKQTKARLMSDKAWCARYLDGGRAERQQMSLISIILSSQIAPEAK